jgi:Cu2+-exporting ATPase
MVQLRVGRAGLKDLPLVNDSAGNFYFKGEGDRTIWLSPHDEIATGPCDAAPEEIDVATAIAIGRGTLRKMRQNLGWAVGYNTLALPLAAGLLEPIGLTLRPEIAAISISGSSILVALNAVALRPRE